MLQYNDFMHGNNRTVILEGGLPTEGSKCEKRIPNIERSVSLPCVRGGGMRSMTKGLFCTQRTYFSEKRFSQTTLPPLRGPPPAAHGRQRFALALLLCARRNYRILSEAAGSLRRELAPKATEGECASRDHVGSCPFRGLLPSCFACLRLASLACISSTCQIIDLESHLSSREHLCDRRI